MSGAKAITTFSDQIVVDRAYGGTFLPGRLAHEGTHLSDIASRRLTPVSYSLIFERRAFHNAYVVETQLGYSWAHDPSPAELRNMYPDLR